MSLYPYHADQGQTNLMAAAYNGDADEIVRILTAPCDIDAQDCRGMTALIFAALKGHTEAVQRLIEKMPISKFNQANAGPLSCMPSGAVISKPS